jgi:hypothetical protein
MNYVVKCIDDLPRDGVQCGTKWPRPTGLDENETGSYDCLIWRSVTDNLVVFAHPSGVS